MLAVHFGPGYLPGRRDLIIELNHLVLVNMGFIVQQFFNQTPQPFYKCMINWFVYFLAILNARESWLLCISL